MDTHLKSFFSSNIRFEVDVFLETQEKEKIIIFLDELTLSSQFPVKTNTFLLDRVNYHAYS